VVFVVGAAYGIGLWLIGNPYWLLFAFLAAILEFIPYIGPFLIGLSASLVALAGEHPGHVIWVVVLSLVIQELENHLLIPLVMKDRMALPPVQLLAAAIAMGVWFGLLGVFATPPLFAVARTIYLETYARRMNRQEP
jgi:predicted PurR-regulated permease PerM